MTQYILISAISLSIFYIAYLFLFRDEVNFMQRRYYLLLTIFFALIIPLNPIAINLQLPIQTTIPGKKATDKNFESTTAKSSKTFEKISTYTNVKSIYKPYKTNLFGIFKLMYLLVSLILIFRLFIQLYIIIIQYHKSERLKQEHYIVIRNSRFKDTFSFFNWIFLQSDYTPDKESEEIISHEKIHASQYHTLDLIMVELLAAVMWFNPFIWMMRNSIQLVHEYLADEGVLSTGIDRLRYQALLINHVAEERLICLSSNFNHSLLKKRMIMMTQSKFHQKTKLKILVLAPLAIILFLGISCINGQNKSNLVTAIEPVRMNVLYIGADNPIKIAASGYETSELQVSIDNGTITGKNGEYIVRPKSPGNAQVIVSNSNGKEIQRTTFRVKNIPDPKAAIKTSDGLKKSGNITKKELLDAGEIKVFMENFDFDLNFTVESFVFSFGVPGKKVIVEELSKSNKFTERQIDEIKSLEKWQKITFEAITVSGPDGKKRILSPMVFLITGE